MEDRQNQHRTFFFIRMVYDPVGEVIGITPTNTLPHWFDRA